MDTRLVKQQYYQKIDIGWSDILNNAEVTMQARRVADGFEGPWQVPLTDVNYKFIDFCSNLGVDVYKVIMFYTHRFDNRHIVHIDDPGPGDWARLNWVYGDNDAEMIWYALRDGHPMKCMYNSTGDLHYFADDDAVEEVVRTKIEANPTIVRTGVLHSAHNYSGKDRFVCQVWLTKNKVTLTFDELVSLFKSYLI